ncbi:halocyanin domain-containing protein [Haloarcula amylovorans]|uniref:halocyanin domain-containing protein n=1 Tax=Haloarcula amylovorans TaxID=2562280 RepID=UPI001075D773|nr:halocyanin domain-containing protein [Halomicroarcula amylolytica]
MTDGSADVSRRTFLRTAAGATAVSAATGAAAAQENGTSTGTATGTATGTSTGTPTGTGTPSGTETGTGSGGNGTSGGSGNETSGGSGNGTSGGGGGGGGPPDYGNWFSNVDNFSDSTTDATGKSSATVSVGAEGNGGNLAFGPPAIHVDNGATVKFEWTGKGGGHNVVSQGEGPLDSGSATSSAGVNYEYTFKEDGIYKYYCSPHQGQGMKGAIVVGSDYPTASTGGEGGSESSPQVPSSAKTLGVATSFVMVATLGLAYFFVRYGGDYEAPDGE